MVWKLGGWQVGNEPLTVLSLNHQVSWCIAITQVLGWDAEDRRIPGAHWPGGLVKLMGSGSSEGPCSEIIKQRVTEEDT